MMSFSSFADEDANKKSGGKDVKAKLAKCKVCNWSSPKFYQLIMNDIPLIICVPMAYYYGLLDPLNAIIGTIMTFSDLVCMIFYLSYDDELSINANEIFGITLKRIEDMNTQVERLLNDDYLSSESNE